LAIASHASTALGDAAAVRSAQAETLYQQGEQLMNAGKPQEACPKFEEAERLDPGVGTEFHLAECYEQTGRTASAWAGYVELAGKVDNADQVTKLRARASALEPKLSRLRITVPPSVAALDGIDVERDGVKVGQPSWGTPAPVDPGKHRVTARANGYAPWETFVDVEQPGATVEIAVPALVHLRGSLFPPTRIAGVVVGAVGVVSLIAGGVLAAEASSTWKAAKMECPTLMACSQSAHDKSTSALAFANAATGTLVAGGILTAAGVALAIVPAPRPSGSNTGTWVFPVVGMRVAGAAVGGFFQ
jgi:hypothetical protein